MDHVGCKESCMSTLRYSSAKAGFSYSMHLRLVFADGSSVDLGVDAEGVKDRLGPVLAALVDGCAPDVVGRHEVSVPEIATAYHGKSLTDFIGCGDGPGYIGELLYGSYRGQLDHLRRELVSAYSAADERLDVPGFVRLVESHVLCAIDHGRLRASVAAEAFAGCRRMRALLDHLPKKPQHPFCYDVRRNLEGLLQEHGAVFVLVGSHGLHYHYVLADLEICQSILDDADDDDDVSLFKTIVDLAADSRHRRRTDSHVIGDDDVTGDDVTCIEHSLETMECDRIRPRDPRTWFPEGLDYNLSISTCGYCPYDLNDMIGGVSRELRLACPTMDWRPIQLVVAGDGTKIFSDGDKGDFVFSSNLWFGLK